MAELVRKEEMRTLLLPQNTFIKTKNNKYIYKNRWTEEYYVVYKNFLGTAWVVETWVGGCNC